MWSINSLISGSVVKFIGYGEQGYNQTEIAKEVGVHKSTISRELKRNFIFVRTARFLAIQTQLWPKLY